jgi:DNA-binding NarL/FixJ family response regulator
VAAIEGVMAEVRKHLKRANIDQPVTAIDLAALAKATPSKAKKGVGDAKREEVRRLILSGLPHKEVVRQSKVSSGTVSLIRSELRSVLPLYRNSESGVRVPFAYPEDESSTSNEDQVPGFIGGPGRTRTCDLTVMSGQL